MTLTTIVAAYLLGGITFIPLLLAAVLIPAWLFSPQYREQGRNTSANKSTHEEQDVTGQGQGEDGSKEQTPHVPTDGTGAASATFAVLRSYHFPSAVAALNVRAPNSGTTGAPGSASNGVVDGREAEVIGNSSSESVYQSMYRSVFDRGRNSANTAPSVLENWADGTPEGSKVKRKTTVSASVFYIVLRHGHLMLYDSPAQLEVRHVISLEHHSISLTDGEEDELTLPDADLFIKRTAIVLTPVQSSSLNGNLAGPGAMPSSQAPRPFYLFCSSCTEKEDFYHALLSTRTLPPVPQPIAPEDLIELQSTLHSTSLTPETRAFNALVGRVFLSVHRTRFLEDLIRNKIEKKIARVQKPTFIAALSVKSISLGDSAPVLSQPRLKDINISGDMTVSFDVRYTGALQVVIAALAKLDLGTRFKARSVDLLLSTSLQRLSGKMLVKIKAPPSNRIWFCFETMPDMDIKVEPVVSSRQITYTFILRAIEDRIRGVVGETLVKPNWDDVPFFNTRHQRVRGGIWRDEEGDDEEEEGEGLTSLETIAQEGNLAAAASGLYNGNANGKSRSTPTLASAAGEEDISAAASGLDLASAHPSSTSLSTGQSKNLRMRAVAPPPQQYASLVDPARQSSLPPPKPPRSPSFISPPPSAPSVAVDEASGVPVRSDDVGMQAKKWRARASVQGTGRKEAVDAVREMRDRSMATANTAHGDSELQDDVQQPSEGDSDESLSFGSSDRASQPRSPFGAPNRTDSERSIASSSATSTSSRQQQRKNLLAATAAATTAARNWGWNAIASRSGAGTGTGKTLSSPSYANSSQTSLKPDQPIGRGQPLPPPGTPLPGPQRGLFSGLGAVGGRNSLKRKPVLPPRKAMTLPPDNGTMTLGSSAGADVESSIAARPADSGLSSDDLHTRTEGEDVVEDLSNEFGPWSENSGTVSQADRGSDGLFDTADDAATLDGEAEPSTIAPEVLAAAKDGESEAGDGARVAKVPPPLPARRRVEPATSSPEPTDLLDDALDSSNPTTSPIASFADNADESTAGGRHEGVLSGGNEFLHQNTTTETGLSIEPDNGQQAASGLSEEMVHAEETGRSYSATVEDVDEDDIHRSRE